MIIIFFTFISKFFSKMWWQILLFFFASLAGYIYLRYHVLPKRRYLFYSQHLKKLGYKVYEFPFTTIGAPYFMKYQKYLQSHGDSLYLEKNVFHEYDIILSNVLDKVCLTFQNLELLKKFYEPESAYKLVKDLKLSEGVRMTLGEGIIFSEKDIWKRKRKIISKAFNHDLLIKNIPIIAKITDETFENLQKQNNLEEKGFIQFEPQELGLRIFSRVMLRCFFEIEFKDNKIDNVPSHEFLASIFQGITELSGNIVVLLLGSLVYDYGLTKSHRKLKQKVKIFQLQILKLIDQKVQRFKSEYEKRKKSGNDSMKEDTKSSDLIQKLLEQKLKGEQSYDSKQLLEQFCTFLVGGTDTTTNFVRSIIFYLCRFPSIQKKVREEIEIHIKSDQDIENIDIMKKLNYFECVQNEVIRMASPSPTCFMRIADEDMQFVDIDLKKGTNVLIEPMANHFNEKYFPNPFEFNPERWAENKNAPVPFTFTGFLGGPRTCLGKHLAFLESKIVVVKLLRRYKKMQISMGGERMEIKFLYGPERYLLKVEK